MRVFSNMKIILLIFIVSFYFCFAVFAAPVINNVEIDQHTVLINGGGFLEKNPAHPLRYFNFDDGVVGEEVPNNEDGGGLYIDGQGQIVYDNSHYRFSGDVSLQQNFLNGADGQIVGLNHRSTFNGAQKLYIHGWWYFNMIGHAPRNCKFPRMGYDFSAPDWQSRIEGDNNSCNDTSAVLITLKPECPMQAGDSAWGSVEDWYRLTGDDENWHRFDSYIDIKAATRWTNIDNRLLIRELNTTDMTVNCEYDDIGYVFFGHYWDNADSGDYEDCQPTPEAQRWWSEIYIDITQARIEICNTSDWQNRSHCEIQIPTAWSDTSITATLNKGSFSNSDQIYVYVIDENGEVSNGYGPIMLGSSASITNTGSASLLNTGTASIIAQ